MAYFKATLMWCVAGTLQLEWAWFRSPECLGKCSCRKWISNTPPSTNTAELPSSKALNPQLLLWSRSAASRRSLCFNWAALGYWASEPSQVIFKWSGLAKKLLINIISLFGPVYIKCHKTFYCRSSLAAAAQQPHVCNVGTSRVIENKALYNTMKVQILNNKV